jgi:hypothetical protein
VHSRPEFHQRFLFSFSCFCFYFLVFFGGSSWMASWMLLLSFKSLLSIFNSGFKYTFECFIHIMATCRPVTECFTTQLMIFSDVYLKLNTTILWLFELFEIEWHALDLFLTILITFVM